MSNVKRLSIIAVLSAAIITGFATSSGQPKYTADGKLMLPTGYRKWVFIGAPLTPNGLNGGKAGFPEFHNVYVEDANLTYYQKNGTFPECTVIVMELVLLRNSKYPDGPQTALQAVALVKEHSMEWT